MSESKQEKLRRLKDMLREICDDPEFVYGTSVIVSHYPNGIELMIEYIERGENVDSDQICMVAMDIQRGNVIFDD